MVENPPANAGDTDSVSDAGGPHVPQSLSSRAQELQFPSPPARRPARYNKSGHCSEQPTHCTWRVAPTRHNQTKAHTAMKSNKANNKQIKQIKRTIAKWQVRITEDQIDYRVAQGRQWVLHMGHRWLNKGCTAWTGSYGTGRSTESREKWSLKLRSCSQRQRSDILKAGAPLYWLLC